MSNFHQPKSRFENLKAALLTEIGRGVIRLAPALVVLYLAVTYFGVSFIGKGAASLTANWLVALALAAWIAYKRIVIFTFIIVLLCSYAPIMLTSPNKLGSVPLPESPFLANLTVATTATIVCLPVLFLLVSTLLGASANAAKNATIEAAKTPEQRLADSKARDDEYQEQQEKEAQEWDEQCHRMNEEKNQEFFDDHHKN